MSKGGRRDLAKENFWRQIIARQKASGKSQKRFCHDEEINHHNFQSWKQVLRSRDAQNRKLPKKKAAESEPQEPFVRILVPEVPEPFAKDMDTDVFTDAIAEIEYMGLKVRILRGVDSASLRAILGAIQERSS